MNNTEEYQLTIKDLQNNNNNNNNKSFIASILDSKYNV